MSRDTTENLTKSVRIPVLEGAGHFPHREKPEAVVEAVLSGPPENP